MASLACAQNVISTSLSRENGQAGTAYSRAPKSQLFSGRGFNLFTGLSSTLSTSVILKSVSPKIVRRAGNVRMGLMGEDPEFKADDYIALGLAHCFVKDDASKLSDVFVIEPIPAGAVECMDNGGVTCFKHVTGTNLGIALQQDVSLLPEELREGKFCEDFDFRTKCASRTWKRQHPQEHLMNLVPFNGVRSDWNFNLQDKRILNMEYEVNDSDNIKQDMSIDVYGRQEDEEDVTTQIEAAYNA